MKQELKDYLHLYLGCEVLVEGDIRKLITIYLNGYVEVNYNDIGGQEFPINEIKPILRPLSDMTEEEIEYTIRLNYRYEVIEIWRSSERFISYRFLYTYGKKPRRSPEKSDFFPVQPKTPEAFKYHLSKHFDLFGLIDAGLAIDKTTLNQ